MCKRCQGMRLQMELVNESLKEMRISPLDTFNPPFSTFTKLTTVKISNSNNGIQHFLLQSKIQKGIKPKLNVIRGGIRILPFKESGSERL